LKKISEADSHAVILSRAEIPYPLGAYLPGGQAQYRDYSRGAQGNQYRGRGRGSYYRPPSNFSKNYSFANVTENDDPEVVDRNYVYLTKQNKGLLSPSHPAFNWINNAMSKRDLRSGDILELARSNQNVFVASSFPFGQVLWDVCHDHSIIEGFRMGKDFTLIQSPVNLVPRSDHAEPIYPDEFHHLTGDLLHYPQIYSRSHSKIQHSLAPDCLCLSPFAQVTNPVIMPSICMKTRFVSPSDWSFPVDPSFSKFFSLSRTYTNTLAGGFDKRYQALVPQPYPLALRWTSKVHVPSYHNRSLRLSDQYLYGLADRRYREQTSFWYSQEPSHWSQDNHPLLQEPTPGSELGVHSLSGYGAESIPRLNFCAVGAAHTFWVSTSNIGEDLIPQEFDLEDPHTQESFLLSMRDEFLSGEGTISCPSCTPKFSSHGRISVVRYDRPSYILHYREDHRSDYAFLGVELGNGLNQRLYEAFALYLFSLCREASDPLSEFQLRDFPREMIRPYTKAADACGIRANLTSSQNSRSERVKMIDPLEISETPPVGPSRPEVGPDPQSFPTEREVSVPTLPQVAEEMDTSVMDASVSSPDLSGLHALHLGNETSETELVPLPRRETSRSRKRDS